MITSLRLKDFKNFADETLRVGPFTVIVGANASGKSNIRDALRFLHGIGRGYTLSENIGGKYGSGGQVEWAPIRGGATEIARFEQSGLRLIVTMTVGREKAAYGIDVGPDPDSSNEFRIRREALRVGQEIVYTTHPVAPDPVRQQSEESQLLLRMAKSGSQRKYGARISVSPDKPALTQISERRNAIRAHKERAEFVKDTLARMRFFDLSPDRMRQPAFPGQTVLGDGGENLPTVLQEICSDPKRKAAISEWLRALTPMDVAELEFPRDPITGLVQLVVREANGNAVSAYSASDGTLRFLAMLTALLGKHEKLLYVFEEIDNGIHPLRVQLLLDLIEKRTENSKLQVITTTHSPDLLSMVSDQTFKNTSVVCRLEDTSDAIIRPVAELPNAAELRKTQGLGRLLAGGWMEDALAFTSEDENGGGAK